MITEGESSAFVMGLQGETYTPAIVPKGQNGWKIGAGADINETVSITEDGFFIHVYRHKSSSDYYITVLNTDGGAAEVSDNRGSSFSYVKREHAALNQTFYTYAAHIKDFDDTYALTINGKTIPIG